MRPVFYTPVFFCLLCFNPVHSEINIAFIDTGFCPKQIKAHGKDILINEAIDLTGSVKLDCIDKKFDKFAPRFHGQLLIEEFIKYKTNKSLVLRLQPLIIYNARGEQKMEYWIKAIEWVKKNKIDVVVSASGLIGNKKSFEFASMALPSLWFVPSGRSGPEIIKGSALFPQELAPLENLFIIGDYYDGRAILYDQGLLYQKVIDYYFPSGLTGFKGTSRAVAEAAAKALSLCPLKTPALMRQCLKEKSKEYSDNLSGKKVKTY